MLAKLTSTLGVSAITASKVLNIIFAAGRSATAIARGLAIAGLAWLAWSAAVLAGAYLTIKWIGKAAAIAW
ncbi:hypothetical protein ABER68_05860 [Paenibacillus alvei]|uniref:hypothetical protein n=1 Tax=Niallia sp. FSL R7-0271 TaxID=2921678 RepID=UPI0030FB34BD